VTGRARTFATRVYRDYAQPERLAAFGALLSYALDAGYQTMTLTAFAGLIAGDAQRLGERILLIRHDIDSDVPRARRMRAVERERGTVGTYFFRHATWDPGFMRELLDEGCEVGYHYEELSTMVKERGARDAAHARALIGPARERLRAAVAQLRASSGLPIDVLAGHGDFANRVVDVSNVELLADASFREQIGVRLEAYDVETHVDVRVSDNAFDGYWEPEDPFAAIARGVPVVEALVHPRAWGRAPGENARLDAQRLLEGAGFSYRRGRARTAARRRGDSADPTGPSPSTSRRS
jgi:hypothetical protein